MPWYSTREDAVRARDLLNKFARDHGGAKRWYLDHMDGYGAEQWGASLEPSTDPNPDSPSLDEDDYLALKNAGL